MVLSFLDASFPEVRSMRLSTFLQSLLWLLIVPSQIRAQGVDAGGAALSPTGREAVAVFEFDFVIVSVAAGVVVTMALVYLVRKLVPE
jgi:hypothetical protein